jgi:small GTP-binding protein
MEDEEGESQCESIKITLLGSSGVGKTCIIKRYTEGSFDESSQSTSGASYSQRYLTIGNRSIQLDLWDTAGQEKYRSLGRHFYKDAFIVCLVYDITNPDSFQDLKEKWYHDLKTYGEKYTVLAVVGSKSDCYEKEEVPEEDARAYAKSIGAIYMLTSAKKGDNIDALFDTLIRQYLGPEFTKKVSEMKADKGEVKKVTNKKNSENKKKNKCC